MNFRFNYLLLVLFFSSCHLMAQDVLISGKILDNATGEPLPFANIIFPRSSTGTASDINGAFRLRLFNTRPTDSLLISFVGYETLRLTIGEGKETSIFRMIPSTTTLDEVVVQADKLNMDDFVREAVRQYNRTRRRDPHIALAHYREKARNANRYIMYAESIGYSIYSGKQFNAALYSNYKFFCDNTRMLADDPDWKAINASETITPGASQNVNLLRRVEERGVLSDKYVKKYRFSLDSSYVSGNEQYLVIGLRGNDEEGTLEIRANDKKLIGIAISTPDYFSQAFRGKVRTDAEIRFAYYLDQPFVSGVRAVFREQDIEYENVLTILVQKYDEFKLSKDTYWSINGYDTNPYVTYDAAGWSKYDIPPDPDMDQILTDLGHQGEEDFPSDRWWLPRQGNEYNRAVVTSLIDNFR